MRSKAAAPKIRAEPHDGAADPPAPHAQTKRLRGAITNCCRRNLQRDLRRRKVFRRAPGAFPISLTIRGWLRFFANPQAISRAHAILRLRRAKVLTGSLVPGIWPAFAQAHRHSTRENHLVSVEK